MLQNYDERIEALTELYEKQVAEFATVQDKLSAATGTATSPKRQVRVTVNPQGEVTELSFPTQAYRRMAPAELAEIVKDTIAKARLLSLAAMSEVMSPFLPSGMSIKDVLSGQTPLSDMVPTTMPEADEIMRSVEGWQP